MNNAEIFNEAEKVVLVSCGRDSSPNCPEGAVDWHIENHVGKRIEKLREVRDITKEKVKELRVEDD